MEARESSHGIPARACGARLISSRINLHFSEEKEEEKVALGAALWRRRRPVSFQRPPQVMATQHDAAAANDDDDDDDDDDDGFAGERQRIARSLSLASSQGLTFSATIGRREINSSQAS